MVPDAAYLQSYGYRRDAKDQMSSLGEIVEDYFPEDSGKSLPKKGGWIMLLMDIHVGKETPEGSELIDVPRLSIWYAMPTVTTFRRKIAGVNLAMVQAIINTPKGNVHVWPHEYKLVEIEKFLEFTEEQGFYMRPLHQETGAFDEKKLHYLRSRGISRADAQRMLLPELNNPNFCFFEFDGAYREVFSDGSGAPYLMPHNHERRALNHARRVA
jgi:hypothetical protein